VRRRGRPPGALNKSTTVAAPKGKQKRVFSEETKKKLAESKRAYWAKVRAEKAAKAPKAGKEKAGKEKASKDKAA
jgi:hypothetical protein